MGRHRVYLAGGCFWGTEAYLAAIPGVLATRVGYANGHVDRPSYEQVCTGTTGAAETVEVVFDDTALALDELLVLFFEVIDPVAVNRQGNDAGTQYRTGVYWTQPADEPVVRGALAWLALACDGEDVAVEAGELDSFFDAEAYHQHYLDAHPGGYCHIRAGAIRGVADRLAALRAGRT